MSGSSTVTDFKSEVLIVPSSFMSVILKYVYFVFENGSAEAPNPYSPFPLMDILPNVVFSKALSNL